MKGPQHSRATWGRFKATCAVAGVSVAAVAAETGLKSGQYLKNSAIRKGHSISMVRARELERLTGFPVSSWPKVSVPKPAKREPHERLTYPQGPSRKEHRRPLR